MFWIGCGLVWGLYLFVCVCFLLFGLCWFGVGFFCFSVSLGLLGGLGNCFGVLVGFWCFGWLVSFSFGLFVTFFMYFMPA